MKYEHITLVLHSLYWLPNEESIEFKIASKTFQAFHGTAPSYISDLLKTLEDHIWHDDAACSKVRNGSLH